MQHTRERRAGYLLAVLAFRTYISVSAISEGRGRQVFFLYIPLSILYIVNEVLTFITGLSSVSV